LLADDTLSRINRDLQDSEPGYRMKRLSEPANRKLVDYNWPGNVRELNNVLIQAAVMAGSDLIGLRDIETAIAETPAIAERPSISFERMDGFSLSQRLSEIESQFIREALNDSGWPDRHGAKSEATKLLGLNSQQDLSKRMKRLKIEGQE
jgi:DNA-binding NtrC family response regulator